MRFVFYSFSFVYFIFPYSIFACTSFFLEKSSHNIVAKTLDWESGDGRLYINKRNVFKSAVLVGNQEPLKWTSQFMNLTITQDGRDFPWEGMNEAGLSVGSLELATSIAPANNDPRPAVDLTQWIQYILDTSKNIPDAILNAQRTRVMAPTAVHYFVCDNNSDCAVFEYVQGELLIYTKENLPYKALTNNTYSDSLNYLHRQENILTASEILEGKSFFSMDRFSRAALLSKTNLNHQQEHSHAFDFLSTVSQRITQWSMVYSLKDKTFYWKTQKSPDLKEVRLTEFNPSCLSDVKTFDINSSNKGYITQQDFDDYTEKSNSQLLDNNSRLDSNFREIMKIFPSTMTLCLEKGHNQL